MEKAKREVHFSLKWGKLDIIVTLLTLLIGIFLSVFIFFMPVEPGIMFVFCGKCFLRHRTVGVIVCAF